MIRSRHSYTIVYLLAALPGNNCGGCGYPGCSGLAAAIVKGEAPVNGCPVGGSEVGAKVAKIMGTDAGESVRQVAKLLESISKKTAFAWHITNAFIVCEMPAQA